MLQIKLIPKNTFRLRTSWTFSFIYPTSFSEGFTNLARKQHNVNTHTYITTLPRSTITNFPSLTITKKICLHILIKSWNTRTGDEDEIYNQQISLSVKDGFWVLQLIQRTSFLDICKNVTCSRKKLEFLFGA